VFSTLGVLVILVALLAGKSRGGLIALAAGIAVFGGMILWRHRTKRTLAVVVGGVAVMTVIVVIFGGQVMERFASEDGKNDPNQLRRDIWANAIAMWRDAPLLGHGAATFPDLFPFYQHLALDDNVVRHPESSWLQWLCELGIIPVVILAGIAGRLVGSRLGALFKRRGTFYLSAGALAGVAAITVHSAWPRRGRLWCRWRSAHTGRCRFSGSHLRGSRSASNSCSRGNHPGRCRGRRSANGRARCIFFRSKPNSITLPRCVNWRRERRKHPTGSGTSRSSNGSCRADGATRSATHMR
jgi:hypothetical protein